MHVFVATAWICACQATDRDLESSSTRRKVNAWICERRATDRDLESSSWNISFGDRMHSFSIFFESDDTPADLLVMQGHCARSIWNTVFHMIDILRGRKYLDQIK